MLCMPEHMLQPSRHLDKARKSSGGTGGTWWDARTLDLHLLARWQQHILPQLSSTGPGALHAVPGPCVCKPANGGVCTAVRVQSRRCMQLMREA